MSKKTNEGFKQQAIFFYYIGHATRLKGMSKKQMLEVAQEISTFSAGVPIYYSLNRYKKGELQKMVEIGKLKLISADNDNYLYLKGYLYKMTPLSLMALMYYCIDTVTDGGLRSKPEYAWMKLARGLADARKKSTSKNRKS